MKSPMPVLTPGGRVGASPSGRASGCSKIDGCRTRPGARLSGVIERALRRSARRVNAGQVVRQSPISPSRTVDALSERQRARSVELLSI